MEEGYGPRTLQNNHENFDFKRWTGEYFPE